MFFPQNLKNILISPLTAVHFSLDIDFGAKFTWSMFEGVRESTNNHIVNTIDKISSTNIVMVESYCGKQIEGRRFRLLGHSQMKSRLDKCRLCNAGSNKNRRWTVETKVKRNA